MQPRNAPAARRQPQNSPRSQVGRQRKPDVRRVYFGDVQHYLLSRTREYFSPYAYRR